MTHEQIVEIVIIIAVLSLVFFLSSKIFKYAAKKSPRYERMFSLLNRVIRISSALLATLLVIDLFIPASYRNQVVGSIPRMVWLSFVTMLTIVSVAVSSEILKKRMVEKGDPQEYKTFQFVNFLVKLVIYILGAALAIIAIPALQVYAKSLLASAGVLTVSLGFASQEAISNITSGLLIIFYKPFRIGDLIKLPGNMEGRVEDITLRHTVIRNFRNQRIVIPNSVINKEKLINYSLKDPKICQFINIGISYDSDIDKAKAIMVEECEKHPNILDNRSEIEKANEMPMVKVSVISLDDNAVMLRAWAWAYQFDAAFKMKCDLLESIKKRFDKEGIGIPFPQRTIHIHKEDIGQFPGME